MFVLPHFLSSDRRYIKWLSVVTIAFNYNVWLATARLCFPYHTPAAIPFWIFFDVLADLVNIIDITMFQTRLQFVKAGDIIVSLFINACTFHIVALGFQLKNLHIYFLRKTE